MKKVAIIGAGASGLLCAIFCSKNGLDVDVFEQNSKCGKKILVSGNGRCNITNTEFSPNDYFSENQSFCKYALETFSFKDFQKFCSSIGLHLDIKNDGKVYPQSNEAKSVVTLLENYAKHLGVQFHLNTRVSNLSEVQSTYDSVVVATGSEAAPHLGGNEDGVQFAQSLQHTYIPTYPSLVQLELEGQLYSKMNGSKVYGEVTLLINNKKHDTKAGDILFTNYGVSGFAILDISQAASEALRDYQTVDLSLNLLPKFNNQTLSSYILKMKELYPQMTLLDIIHGLLPLKISTTLVESLGFSSSDRLETINTKTSKKIANQILNWKFHVTQTHGFRHAEVSGGGVNTLEINPKTFESYKEKNIYFIGEVLDVVGRRGGFNFAWAWASAYCCSIALQENLETL